MGIENMCIGVTEGYMYKMRTVHAHFPINCSVPKDGSCIDIKNFLGGKQIKHVDMIPGVTVKLSVDVKDELIFEGFDNAAVSLCCARVCQAVNSEIRMSVSSSMVSSSPRSALLPLRICDLIGLQAHLIEVECLFLFCTHPNCCGASTP